MKIIPRHIILTRRSFVNLLQTKITPPYLKPAFGQSILDGQVPTQQADGSFLFMNPLPPDTPYRIRIFRNGQLQDESDYTLLGNIIKPTKPWTAPPDKVEIWILC